MREPPARSTPIVARVTVRAVLVSHGPVVTWVHPAPLTGTVVSAGVTVALARCPPAVATWLNARKAATAAVACASSRRGQQLANVTTVLAVRTAARVSTATTAAAAHVTGARAVAHLVRPARTTVQAARSTPTAAMGSARAAPVPLVNATTTVRPAWGIRIVAPASAEPAEPAKASVTRTDSASLASFGIAQTAVVADAGAMGPSATTIANAAAGAAAPTVRVTRSARRRPAVPPPTPAP